MVRAVVVIDMHDKVSHHNFNYSEYSCLSCEILLVALECQDFNKESELDHWWHSEILLQLWGLPHTYEKGRNMSELWKKKYFYILLLWPTAGMWVSLHNPKTGGPAELGGQPANI